MKAKHNCWTCKERKVGCDRALPECANCTRSNRRCQGYGLKLAWPDKFDGRRKQKRYEAAPEGTAADYITQDGHFSFLNTTFEDLSGQKINFQEVIKRERSNSTTLRMVPAVSPIPNAQAGDSFLLSYWDSVLARMITTVDDNTNGFRLDLIPMALSSSDASSRGLLHATLALSSFHLGRQEDALRHKVQSIKSLSESFQGETTSKLTQLATCMMLCVYSVFDASDTTWHVHLQGAKTLKGALSEHDRQTASFHFLSPWFDYHHTFSGYSHSTDPPFQDGMPNIILPESNNANEKIIGLLGCSTELLQLISCINQLRAIKSSSQWTPLQAGRDTMEAALLIRTRLQNLKQVIQVEMGETAGTIDHQRVTLTAEFYRIAALLYLYQVMPSHAVPDKAVKGLVQEGFIILDSMEVCTSPWPLFILACNVSSDTDRLKAMAILEKANSKRNIGNYELIKGLIQAVWKQQDLIADEKTPAQIDWRTLVDPNSSTPSFI